MNATLIGWPDRCPCCGQCIYESMPIESWLWGEFAVQWCDNCIVCWVSELEVRHQAPHTIRALVKQLGAYELLRTHQTKLCSPAAKHYYVGRYLNLYSFLKRKFQQPLPRMWPTHDFRRNLFIGIENGNFTVRRRAA
jgi:hypothetical protein